MNNAKCERKNNTKTKEGRRLMQINEDWKAILKDLCQKNVFGKNKLEELENANFGAAILQWKQPNPRGLSPSKIVTSNGKIIRKQPGGFFQKPMEEIVYACSRISKKEKKMSINNHISQDFHDKMIVIEKKKEDFGYNHLNVDDYRSIGIGHERHNDVEAKILEYITDFVEKKSISEFTVHLFTQLEPCLSCDYVIIKFTERFPKSNMYLYYEEAYNKLIIP
ncbi:hypothetical protein OIU11_01965 [Bacillus cereus]|uniref:deaminase domain-containing protein n=1 Tax=Bacillus cereus TaxID=1396 RepID=UPI002226AFEF|nr:deaminase domain-containing protein [Bacillus cereus]UYY94324.1 hypothetical protein OIU11_01965 [Bacillus cereus]